MDAKIFGAFIAQVRKSKKLTQSELATKLHVTDKAVSRWERELGFPDINSLEILASSLDISIMELMQSRYETSNDFSNKNISVLIKSAVDISKKNRKQERTALVLAIYTTVIVALIFWEAGFGNLMGSLLFGAITAVTSVSIYYYLEEIEDVESRKIYVVFGIISIVLIVLILSIVI